MSNQSEGTMMSSHAELNQQWRDAVERDCKWELEWERWERMRLLHADYERLRERAVEKGVVFKDDSGTATRLRTVFGSEGSLDNAWWTTWRPVISSSTNAPSDG